MNIDQLEYGQQTEIAVVLSAGRGSAAAWRRSQEVRIWRDPASDRTLLGQGEQTAEIEGASAKDERVIADLCSINLPRLAWLFDLKAQGSKIQVLLQVHSFPPPEIEFSELKIAVDEKIVESANKINRKLRDVSAVQNWLSDQCLLQRERTGKVSLFMTIGAGKEKDWTNGFQILGKSVRLFLTRVNDTVQGSERSYFRVEKISRTRSRDNTTPVFHASGGISFSDDTTAGRLQGAIYGELASLAESEGNFLQIWQRYGEMEEKALYDKATAIGALKYDGWEPRMDGTTLFHLADVYRQAAETLEKEDSLEAGFESPEYLAPEANGQSFEERGKGKRRNDGIYSGKVDQKFTPDTRILVLRDDSEARPPQEGVLFLSVSGDRSRFERRGNAQKAIMEASCPMPQLGLLLMDRSFACGRHSAVDPISTNVCKKVFGKNKPTATQEAALSIALNTPDIALIQGPPGTGKTTIIKALIERLNELAATGDVVAGSFLLTSFQHDAVENALARLMVNDLPAKKFGGRRGEEDQSDVNLERWILERVEKVRDRFPTGQRLTMLTELQGIVTSYLLAPCTQLRTAEMLGRVRELVRLEIPSAYLDELDELHRRFLTTSTGGDTDLERRLALLVVRGLRVTEAAFADDGPSRAYSASRQLERLGILDEANRKLLQVARGWLPEDGAPAFLGSLAAMKRKLLSILTPVEDEGSTKVNEDVAKVLGRVRIALEEKYRGSKNGADLVVDEFLREMEQNYDAVDATVAEYIVVYAATCQQAARKDIAEAKGSGRVEYDTVLVDEAARCTPLDLFIPMTQARRRIILVGDHRQLPHIIDKQIERELDQAKGSADSSIAEKTSEILKESLFQRMFHLMKEREKRGEPPRVITLKEQYRMHPVLGDFVSDSFYEEDEAFTSPRGAEEFYHELPGFAGKPLGWLDVSTSLGHETPGTSKSRKSEAERIAEELKRLMDSPQGKDLSFGVITFYSAQVAEIEKQLAEPSIGIMVPREGKKYEIDPNYQDLKLPDGTRVDRFRVGTVDAFQGKEFDVVFLSMVRCNDYPDGTEKERRKKYGHLMSPNRLCVSMSRQMRLLIVVGDSKMLEAPHASEAIGPLLAFRKLCVEKGVIG